MSSSGYVDWHRLERTKPWVRKALDERTSVFAFWTVDYGVSEHDRGVTLLKETGRHPDWFLHADTADQVLAAYPKPHSYVSPNFTTVFEDNLSARPLLASLLLGTANASFRNDGRLWWCSPQDLTRRGRTLLKHTSRLYEREPHLITFIEQPTDENEQPRGHSH